MSSRRDLLKAGAAAGGLAAFAGGFSETATRAVKGWVEGDRHLGTKGRSLDPEFRVDPAGHLQVNPDQQVSYTMCMGCTTYCGVRVRIDKTSQTVMRVVGNPYSPLSADPHLPYGTPIRASFVGVSRFEERGLGGRSTACGRGNAVLAQMASPYRVTQPLKRVGPRNSGRWEPISFEQLVKEVSEGGDLFGEGPVAGLAALRDFSPIDPDQPQLGPKVNRVALLTSTNDGREAFARRFMQQSYGTINFTGHGAFCGGSYRAGSGAAFGDTKHMPHAKPDLQNAEFIIFIGTAPGNAGNPFKRQGTLLAKARSDGKLTYVVVDPVLNHSDNRAAAERANWIPIRPATDGALAMAMIRWIMETERYDAKFLAQPNAQAAEAAGEAAWCNATHLVVAEPGHPREGFFLRGSDLGQPVAEAQRYTDADPFVVMDAAGQPVAHDKATGPAALFVDGAVAVGGQPVRVCSSLDLLKAAAMEHTVEEYAAACGIAAATITGLAREFTSHGKHAAVNSHGGTMAGNGFYNAFALVSLNTLIGNLNWKGGTFVNGGGFKVAEGPRYHLDSFDGEVKPGGTPLSRNVAYEKSAEFKKKAAGGHPYPADRPWFPIAPQLATELFPAAVNGYPYGLSALVLWNCNPVYGIPGVRKVAEQALGDPKVIPLVIAMDAFINESTAFADYIVPDSGMYECWGFAAAWGGIPTKAMISRWPVVEPRQAKTADGQPVAMESFFIALAVKLGLAGFGPGAIKDGDGNAQALERAEDYYLRAAANLAWLGKTPVPDAGDDDIALSGIGRVMPMVEAVLKEEERRKVAFMLARGGRFQNASESFVGERPAVRFAKPLQLYNEALGTARDAIGGQRYSGVPVWTPPRFADGTPVRHVHSEQDWPMELISFKSPLQNSYSIGARRLRGLHPDNPVAINPADAARFGIATGDAIRITSPGGTATGVAVVRRGVMAGVLAIEHGFGHREHGARGHLIGGRMQPADPAIAAGVCLNDLGIADPTRAGASVYVDPVSGTAVRQGIPARVEKI